MEQQEYFMRMQMLGQEAEKIEQQIQTIDQQISELASVKESIEAIKEGKQKELLTNLGKGIFVKTELKDKSLLVNVGKETIVKKSAEETIGVIVTQTQKLIVGKEQLISRIQELQENMQNLLLEAQRSGKHEHSCECGDESCNECDGNCDCEEPCDDCKHKR